MGYRLSLSSQGLTKNNVLLSCMPLYMQSIQLVVATTVADISRTRTKGVNVKIIPQCTAFHETMYRFAHGWRVLRAC